MMLRADQLFAMGRNEDAEKLIEARRARDRNRQPTDEAVDGQDEEPTLDDPQLRRAIEYLEEQMRGQETRSRTARRQA